MFIVHQISPTTCWSIITNYQAEAIFASATCKMGNSVCKFCFSANGLQTGIGITICVPIQLRAIFRLKVSVFSQLFSCSMILSLSPLPFVDSRNNGRA